MRVAAPIVLVSLFYGPASADESERFAERAPLPRTPAQHTQQRAGNPAMIAPWAVSGLGRRDTGGYVGGGRPGLFSSGPATGPTTCGTFGWDYGGWRPGRVFLAS